MSEDVTARDYTAKSEDHWSNFRSEFKYEPRPNRQHEADLEYEQKAIIALYVEKRAILGSLSDKSVQKYYLALRCLTRLLKERQTSFPLLTEADALFLIQSLQTLRNYRGELLSEETRSEWFQIWKAYMRYAKKKYGPGWDACAFDTIDEHIYKRNRNKQKKKSIFSPDEINILLKAEKDLTWRVFFETYFVTGPRIGEILVLCMKHLSLYEDGTASIYFPSGKTGPRTVYVVGRTAETLRRWQALHPYYDDPEAPLFLNTKLRCMSYKAVEKHFKDLVKMSGLFKDRATLQSIRASSATNDAQYMSEQSIKKKYGWTQNSPMLGRYIRQSGIDLKEAELQAQRARTLDIHDIV